MNCGPLPAPRNGSFSGNSTVFPNSVLFDCDPGFQLKGSFWRMCQANGIWSGLTAICVGKLGWPHGRFQYQFSIMSLSARHLISFALKFYRDELKVLFFNSNALWHLRIGAHHYAFHDYQRS